MASHDGSRGDRAMTHRRTGNDLRRGSRSAVLRLLLLDGPLNRLALSRQTGLSGASVTNVVSDLLDERLVVEVGTQESDGGRPSVQLSANPDFGVVAGVDIGETGVCIETFDLTLNKLKGVIIPIDPRRPAVDETVAAIAQTIGSLVDRPQDAEDLLGVGVGVPGIVFGPAEQARVNAPNIGWDDVPLAKLLEDALGTPVLIENCSKTLGLAEMWFGAGRGTRDTIVTLLGTGVGAAIFSRGQLFRGASSSAGEWGHTCIVVNGRKCRCGGQGCLEAYIGASAIAEQWTARGNTTSDAADEKAVIEELISASAKQAIAQELINETAQAAGIGLANLVNLFNPERIIIGGWLGLRLGPLLLPRISEVLSDQALAHPAARVSIQLGELGEDAAAFGASTLVVNDLISRGGKPRINASPPSRTRRW